MLRILLWLLPFPFTTLVFAAENCGLQTALRDSDFSQECAAHAYRSVLAARRRVDADLKNPDAIVCSYNTARSAEGASAVGVPSAPI
jgi:hypothetical protein